MIILFLQRLRCGILFLLACGAVCSAQSAPALHFVSSTASEPWKESSVAVSRNPGDEINLVTLEPQTVYQTVDGFGGCFNELAWQALQSLDAGKRAVALKALFDADGCNFNLCRVGIGANDFALNWYSFDETPGDYAMTNFSIARDETNLIPFIKAAMAFQPGLAVWGVPWSPPSWMKSNNAYKGGRMNQDPQMLAAYALYFSKYVQAYRADGVNLYAVHPQNEPRYNTGNYPQCAWNGQELDTFLRDYLVPQLKKDHVDVQVWLGTMVNANIADYVDPVLGDAATRPAISGVGSQYAGQGAMLDTHRKYPEMKMLQTETECYKGSNSWDEAMTTFRKTIEDMNHFANGYTFWNMILDEKSTSSWGWKQNSLLKIDTHAKEIIYNPEFYSLKHFGHFVRPGAVRIGVSAVTQIGGEDESTFTPSNVIAFRNPSGELVFICANAGDKALPLTLRAGGNTARLDIPARSMNTAVLSGW